jgi:hypothetical protein
MKWPSFAALLLAMALSPSLAVVSLLMFLPYVGGVAFLTPDPR